jgi:2-polyprenyl-3-methyl-5-hydroxy-6-metoxy-1,4-benzoquinol methylase
MYYNSVLKNTSQIDEAVKYLLSLNLFPHHDRVKSWDVSKMVDIINKADRTASILDVGCNGSPILLMLKSLGFTELYGCDLFFDASSNSQLGINKTAQLNLSIQNLENTNYRNDMFDYITSLSVIEHGVNIEKYFIEMNRILKKDGILLTSTDYWHDKINNSTKVFSFSTVPDKIFSRSEIENIVMLAEENGFELIEPIDYLCEDKVVHWHSIGIDLTFLFFALRKKTHASIDK